MPLHPRGHRISRSWHMWCPVRHGKLLCIVYIVHKPFKLLSGHLDSESTLNIAVSYCLKDQLSSDGEEKSVCTGTTTLGLPNSVFWTWTLNQTWISSNGSEHALEALHCPPIGCTVSGPHAFSLFKKSAKADQRSGRPYFSAASSMIIRHIDRS